MRLLHPPFTGPSAEVPKAVFANTWYKVPERNISFRISGETGQIQWRSAIVPLHKTAIIRLSISDYKFIVKLYKKWLSTNPMPYGIVRRGETYPLVWEPTLRELLTFGELL